MLPAGRLETEAETTLPPVNDPSDYTPLDPAAGSELKLEPAPPEPPAEARILLSLPFAPLDPHQHHKRHIELQLNRPQAAALARLTTALRGQPYELTVDESTFRSEGRIIDGPAKVFYWLLNGATLLMAQADAAASSEKESSGDSAA